MFDLVGEVVEGADGNALLGGVAGRSVSSIVKEDCTIERKEKRKRGYDSVRLGTTTWVLPLVPSVPDSSNDLR